MGLNDFEVGKDYSYDKIEKAKEADDNLTLIEYGPSICEEEAMHLSDGFMNAWFILTGVAGENYIYTCVMNQ